MCVCVCECGVCSVCGVSGTVSVGVGEGGGQQHHN